MAENIRNSSEMREKSLDWNLACDVQLRKRLELTAQRFQQKALSLSESIKDLNAKSTVTAAKLGNVTNSLLLLSNIQFIESRVYEDEDTPETGLDTKQDSAKENLSQPQKEHKFKTDIGNALSAGAVFIQNAFEKVELEQSDSDDDEEVVSALEPIYESRNVYHSRKLPHVIGTQSFLSDEYIGLEHSPEDIEKDELSESSESESEDEIEDLEDLKSNLEPTKEVTEPDFAATALNPGNEIKIITDHQDSEFSSENEDDFPTKSTAKTTIKKTGNSSKPEVAKSSISASGIFDDQDQKDDTAKDNDFEDHIEKNEEVQFEIEQKKKIISCLNYHPKLGAAVDQLRARKKIRRKLLKKITNLSNLIFHQNLSNLMFQNLFLTQILMMICLLQGRVNLPRKKPKQVPNYPQLLSQILRFLKQLPVPFKTGSLQKNRQRKIPFLMTYLTTTMRLIILSPNPDLSQILYLRQRKKSLSKNPPKFQHCLKTPVKMKWILFLPKNL